MSRSSIVTAVKDWKKMTAVGIIILANVLLLISNLSPASELNATIPVTMPTGKTTTAGLEGYLYLYGFDVAAVVESEMLEDGGMSIRNERFFLQGPGPELPERLGIIMNSYKDINYEIVARTSLDIYENRDNGGTIIVHSHIDRVPFWIEGVEEHMSISISLNDTWNLSKVEVSKVWVEVWTDYDDDVNEYTRNEIIWEREVRDVLTDTEDVLDYSLDLEYVGTQERIGIVTRIDCNMTDVEGNVDESPSAPFKSDSYPHPHNVYLVTHTQAGKVILMVAAFPMFIIAALLSIVGIIQIIRDNGKAVKFILASGILVLLGMFFYWWGVMTILEMTEVSSAMERLLAGRFSWNWSFFLLIPSSILFISSSIFIRIGKVLPKKEIVYEGEKNTEKSQGHGDKGS